MTCVDVWNPLCVMGLLANLSRLTAAGTSLGADSDCADMLEQLAGVAKTRPDDLFAALLGHDGPGLCDSLAMILTVSSSSIDELCVVPEDQYDARDMMYWGQLLLACLELLTVLSSSEASGRYMRHRSPVARSYSAVTCGTAGRWNAVPN